MIYPTDTVYGLGCDPADPDATKRICIIKGRADRPLPLICSDTEAARRIVEFNTAAEKLTKRLWPGPLTLVLPRKVDYPLWVLHGSRTLGVRVPDSQTARELARLSGGVIVSTSANRSGEEPPATAGEAERNLGKEVDIILDGGPARTTQPSTVLDISTEELWILRSGPITAKQIKEALSA